jgi:hypothetical protein
MGFSIFIMFVYYLIILGAGFLTSNIFSKFHLRKYRPGIWLLPLAFIHIIFLDYLTDVKKEVLADASDGVQISVNLVLLAIFIGVLYLGMKSDLILRLYKSPAS